MSGIMSMFSSVFGGGSAPAQQVQQTQQPAPGNIPPNSGNPTQVPGDPTQQQVQQTQQNQNQTQQQTSPLDQFTELWKTPDVSQDQQDQNNQQQIDPKKLMEAASKVDFAKVVTPELMQAIAAGGEAGVAASLQAMNKMAQTVYAQSAIASTKIVDQAVAKAQEQFTAQIPNLIKKHTVSDSLRTDNPAFSHPAVQPIMSALESQFTQKYPNATASEIKKLATDYMQQVANVFNPGTKQDTKQQQQTQNDFDWSTYLDGQSQ